MLIDANMTFAFKCSSCGSFQFFNASLFTLAKGKQLCFRCRCRKSSIAVLHTNAGNYRFEVPCIGCGSNHTYGACRKSILYHGIQVFDCPVTGIKLLFAGRDPVVRTSIDKLEHELDTLMDAFGYDKYFVNTQVMMDSLNKIHEVAECGNLICECGSTDIELMLLPDRIFLTCRRCSMGKSIYTRTNEDLKNTLPRQHILLESRYTGRGTGNNDNF